MKTIITCICWLGLALTVNAQGYKITCKIEHQKPGKAMLVSYFGSSNVKMDSAKIDAKGQVVFEGKKALPQGLYMFVFRDDTTNLKFFDFIVGEEQNFTLSTDTAGYAPHMKIKGSKENALFYEYQIFISEQSKKAKPLSEALEKAKGNKVEEDRLRADLRKIDEEVKAKQKLYMTDNTNMFFAKFLRAMQEIDVPEAPKLPNGRVDSTFGYRYYKAHYFDYIDFTDERMLRTPFFNQKIEFYLEKLAWPHPDSIAKECIYLCEKARPDSNMFRYLVAQLTYKYETSKIVGHDAIFVALGKKYYQTKQTWWVHDTVMVKFEKRIKALEPLLIGKKAPNLVMLDLNNQWQTLHTVNARFTIVFFMDPDCGHCKKEMVKLKDLYDRKNKPWDLQVYQVFSDTSLDKMRKYVNENGMRWICVNGPRNYETPYHDLYDINSTPLIYILDRQKLILSKKLPAESVEDFLNHQVKKEDGD